MLAREEKHVALENDYVDKIAFLNELAKERIAFLATFKLPGIWQEDMQKLIDGQNASKDGSTNGDTNTDGDMTVNMDGVPLPKNEFLQKILPGAIKAYAKWNILPSLTLAQGALESGWGKHGIGNNMFGIKAGKSWTGKKQLVWTHEEQNGVKVKVQAYFRDYDSIDDAVLDHGKLLGENSRYKKVLTAKNYKEAAKEVRAAGYATDGAYVSLITNMVEKNKMDTWDDPKYKKLVNFTPVSGSGSKAKGDAKKIIDTAEAWLKKPNKYGMGWGRSKSDIKAGRFDCSSFCRYIFAENGYDIMDNSFELWGSTRTVVDNKKLKHVKTADLQPGDLVFFDTYQDYGHITIYIGDNKCIGSQSKGVGIFDMHGSYWKTRISASHRRILS